jgi:cytoskeletal protein CcmA (bactofilin family)
VMKFRRKTASDEISGFLDQGTNVTGELRFSGTLRVDGNFHGSISTSDVLIVGEHAVVHADITVGEIEVHGKVFGRIESKRRVEIFSTGRIQGDIHAPVLIMQSGGVFDGRSYMTSEGETASPVAREATRAVKGGIEPIHGPRPLRSEEV